MIKAIRLASALGLALAIAACATTPPPQADLTPPPKKCDAKTQLEAKRTRC